MVRVLWGAEEGNSMLYLSIVASETLRCFRRGSRPQLGNHLKSRRTGCIRCQRQQLSLPGSLWLHPGPLQLSHTGHCPGAGPSYSVPSKRTFPLLAISLGRLTYVHLGNLGSSTYSPSLLRSRSSLKAKPGTVSPPNIFHSCIISADSRFRGENTQVQTT